MTRETTIDWPEDILGCPLRSGYRREQRFRYKTLEVADGPPRFRLTSDDETQVCDVTFFWDETQMDAWEQFHDETLSSGSLWFKMPMLAGAGFVPAYAHMAGGWTQRLSTERLDRFEVSFTVEMFYSAESQPPALVLSDPIDALSVAVARPVDIIDADGNPADIVDALAPEVWP